MYKNLEQTGSITKSFSPHRSLQIYRIVHVDTTTEPYLYKLHDLLNRKVMGYYYAKELKHAPDPKTVTFPVEKVLDRRKKGGKWQYFVKFKDYPKTFNTWIGTLKK